MTDTLRFGVAVIVIAAGLFLSYLLALAGEPSSHWLWCIIGTVC